MPENFIPKRPAGDDDEARFMQAVWDAIWGGKFPFLNTPECQWSRGAQGYWPKLAVGAGGPGGTLVYIPVCLEDGTLAYAPFRIYGKIYALADGTGYVTPTIDAGSVPDGAKILQ